LEFIAFTSTDYKKFRVGDINPNPTALELLAVPPVVVVKLPYRHSTGTKSLLWLHVN